MIFLQNVHEARERLADIAEQLGNGEIHSAVLLNEGVPVSVMVPWADFCVMLEALEAVSGVPATKQETAGHAARTCGEPPATCAPCENCAGGNVTPEERPPVYACTSSESKSPNSAVEAAATDGRSFRLALDPILLD
ncbi:hypothetical protein LN040_04315 [Desulfovibrio subterraneus]|uniref:Antitoxin n=1 Tax=Desulfovibrio subterraneus TaxID=2718620 RepID=A0A7J0BKS6_9BACT|nr:hypothetical protein [Desulfovibrio subterraneus]WBF68334.1 hypothetical protein LN040_04315 [Desulfovibrio subterraneus]GFM34286.1 hypothetical protein DSM101010T_26510 [Desulfovibrio subterraneus]